MNIYMKPAYVYEICIYIYTYETCIYICIWNLHIYIYEPCMHIIYASTDKEVALAAELHGAYMMSPTHREQANILFLFT